MVLMAYSLGPSFHQKIRNKKASMSLTKYTTLAATAVFLTGCMTTNPYTREPQLSKTAGGAMIGAATGAVVGAIASGGKSSRSKRKSILIGAGVGALTGGAIGAYMDSQEAELRQQLEGTGVSVTRNGDQIILNMPGNITFNSDQDAIKSQFYGILNSVGSVLNKYNQSLIDIAGHTDSTGGQAHNQALSERRAMSVANYLNGRGVDGRRMSVYGYGPSRPIASNATAAGRAQNRRVEIQIAPL